MKKILITGCAGFIGSHLSEKLLNDGNKVIGIDNFDNFYDKKIKENNIRKILENKNFSFYEIDIRKKEQLNLIKEEDIQIVIHLAAKPGVLPSLKNPEEYIIANIIGTQNILDFIKNKKIKKYIFASSSSVYGNNKKIPFCEDDITDNPISPYAFTKKSCELLNFTYHKLYNIDTINLRLFTVYGPRQRPDLAIHKFTKMIIEGLPILVYGDGTSSRDYTYVDDIIDGIILSIEAINKKDDIFEIINLGNESPIPLNKLISIISEYLCLKPKIINLPKQLGEVEITYASIEKARRFLGYNPKFSITYGIAKFIDWYKQNYN